jgi:hypothetical protein
MKKAQDHSASNSCIDYLPSPRCSISMRQCAMTFSNSRT